MPDKVGVGLIGCGGMGSHHARNLAEIEGRIYADSLMSVVKPLNNYRLKSAATTAQPIHRIFSTTIGLTLC